MTDLIHRPGTGPVPLGKPHPAGTTPADPVTIEPGTPAA
jgi:hypothetical protein